MNKEQLRKLLSILEKANNFLLNGTAIFPGSVVSDEIKEAITITTRLAALDDGIKYLIEDKKTQEWYCLGEGLKPLPHDPGAQWTNDPNRAIQFNTRKEAQDFFDKHLRFDWCHITEHKFVDDGQEGKGLRWVKASERLPKKPEHWPYTYGTVNDGEPPIIFVNHNHSATFLWYHSIGWDVKDEFKKYENPDLYDVGWTIEDWYWLDESAALPVADGEGQKVGSDCSNHKKDLFGQTDMKVVAESIGDLHYKTLSQLFFELQTKFHNDAMNDLKGEKFKVAHHLGRISNHQFEASIDAESLWLICKPFMEPKCPRCKGDGIVEKNVKGFEGEPEYDTEVECPECGGSGKENNE